MSTFISQAGGKVSSAILATTSALKNLGNTVLANTIRSENKAISIAAIVIASVAAAAAVIALIPSVVLGFTRGQKLYRRDQYNYYNKLKDIQDINVSSKPTLSEKVKQFFNGEGKFKVIDSFSVRSYQFWTFLGGKIPALARKYPETFAQYVKVKQVDSKDVDIAYRDRTDKEQIAKLKKVADLLAISTEDLKKMKKGKAAYTAFITNNITQVAAVHSIFGNNKLTVQPNVVTANLMYNNGKFVLEQPQDKNEKYQSDDVDNANFYLENKANYSQLDKYLDGQEVKLKPMIIRA